jgi:hypothetical protein
MFSSFWLSPKINCFFFEKRINMYVTGGRKNGRSGSGTTGPFFFRKKKEHCLCSFVYVIYFSLPSPFTHLGSLHLFQFPSHYSFRFISRLLNLVLEEVVVLVAAVAAFIFLF